MVPLDQHDARHEGFALFAHLALDAPARADAEIAEFTDLIGGVPALHHAVELFRTLVERVAAELLSDGTNGVSVIDAATNSVTATIPFSGAGPGVAVSPDGTKVYVVTFSSNSEPAVSVIATKSNMVIATIPLGIGAQPQGLAVSPDGSRVYVANQGSNTVSVIATATDMVTATIPVGVNPLGVAVTPDSSKVYVANFGSGTISAGTVSVIDAATNMVTATIPDGGVNPYGLAVTPDGTKVYVANANSANVSVIDTTSSTVTATIAVPRGPNGVAVTGDGTKVYVVSATSPAVSVIDAATDMVTATIPFSGFPLTLGIFIQPRRTLTFAGTPGKANCHGKSVSALVKQYGGLNNAAAALGFDSVKALQEAIQDFCAA